MDSRQFMYQQLAEASQELTSDRVNDETWTEDPVGFEEFVTTPRFLHLPALTYRQRIDLETFLGADPKQVFNKGSQYNLLCLLAGKGSGKDYMASLVVTYCFYILMCMKNPQEYFGFPTGESLDMIIVSFSAEQAQFISFDKIKKRMENFFWLKSKYTVVLGEKPISNKGKPIIYILQDRIISPNNVRIISEHSQNESYEGYNILVFVMSEASAFKSKSSERNAEKVFSTLQSSASSRFLGRYKGMVMSYPRNDPDTDFTIKLYEQSKTDAVVWGSMGAPWEYKPARFYSGKYFEYEIEGEKILIPVEHQDDFEKYPEESRTKFLCRPSRGGKQVMGESMLLSAVKDHQPIVRFEQYIENSMVKLKIIPIAVSRLTLIENLLITVDLGKVRAAAAVAIQHWDQRLGYILDAIGSWTPDVKQRIIVDMVDVDQRLEDLLNLFPNARISFDHWNSELYVARLTAKGFKADQYQVRSKHGEDYDMFNKAIGANLVSLLNYKELLQQLSAIKVLPDGEIYINPELAVRKDLVDVVVGGFKILVTDTGSTQNAMGGMFIGRNIDRMGGTMIQSNVPRI